MQAPSSATNDGIVSIRDLIDFLAHVADCYPQDTAQFPQDLMHILNTHHEALEPELREKVVGSLVLLRRKDIIDSSTLVYSLLTHSMISTDVFGFEDSCIHFSLSSSRPQANRYGRSSSRRSFRI